MKNWTKLYNRYEKMYDAKKAKSEVGMEEKYSELEFKTMVVSMESDVRTGVTHSKDIVRDLVNKQEKYKYSIKQAKVIQERLGRIQSHISTNKRWKYLYERARNYFAYAGAVSNSLDDFTNVLQPFLAKATHQVVNTEPKNSEKASDVKHNNTDNIFDKDIIDFDKDIFDKDVLTNYLERLFKF